MKYNTFLSVFIISLIALVVFIVFYFQAIFNLISTMDGFHNEDPSPVLILNTIFSPSVLISALVLGLSSLAYRIMGIVQVAKNKAVQDGEKALWIIGFVVLGFITAILFLVMAKNKKFVSEI